MAVERSESTLTPGDSDIQSDFISSSEEKEYAAADDGEQHHRSESDQSEADSPTFEEGWPSLLDSVESTTSSVSFKSDLSKDHNPYFKGRSSLKVPLENQRSASTDGDGRDDPTEDFREGKFSFKRMLGDGVRRLLRRVSKNNMEV